MAALSFFEQRLDARITHGATGGPTVPGRVKRYTASGRLSQNFSASRPIHHYDISHGLRSRDDYQIVLDLWYVVMFTPYSGFRYKDWRDYQATRTNSKLTLISGTTWQLQRRHVAGSIEFLRDIVKPCASPAVVIYDASGTPLTATVDTATGIATVPSGTPATWAGEFDVPVTFTDDEWTGSSLEVATSNLHVMSGPIKVEEIQL